MELEQAVICAPELPDGAAFHRSLVGLGPRRECVATSLARLPRSARHLSPPPRTRRGFGCLRLAFHRSNLSLKLRSAENLKLNTVGRAG